MQQHRVVLLPGLHDDALDLDPLPVVFAVERLDEPRLGGRRQLAGAEIRDLGRGQHRLGVRAGEANERVDFNGVADLRDKCLAREPDQDSSFTVLNADGRALIEVDDGATKSGGDGVRLRQIAKDGADLRDIRRGSEPGDLGREQDQSSNQPSSRELGGGLAAKERENHGRIIRGTPAGRRRETSAATSDFGRMDRAVWLARYLTTMLVNGAT